MLFYGTRYSKTSAYLAFLESNNLPVVILGYREEMKCNKDELTYYQFRQGDRLDKIAYKFYGEANYATFILDANPKYQSELDIVPGDVIAIPSFMDIMEVIESAD
jgi:phage tail protein X